MVDKVTQFAVIEFEGLENGRRMVELVPTNWLTADETLCFWPPENEECNVPKWVELECRPGRTWTTYPIKVLSKAKDHDQGLRRLKRSYKKKDVDSSESESQSSKNDDEPTILSSACVAQLLSTTDPLRTGKKLLNCMEYLDKIEPILEYPDTHEVTDQEDNCSTQDGNCRSELRDNNEEMDLALPSMEPKGIMNFDQLAKYLQGVIEKEMYRVRKSVNHTIGQKTKKILEVVQYSAETSGKQEAWKNIGADFPFENDDHFKQFDESLKNNEQKRNALSDIFRMITAGCIKYEEDVTQIMRKLLKKDVQLLYSACGKKSKGVGKKSFRETETFKVMEEYLTAKYHASKEKPAIITAISHYLSGAGDRDGGRAQRNKN